MLRETLESLSGDTLVSHVSPSTVKPTVPLATLTQHKVSGRFATRGLEDGGNMKQNLLRFAGPPLGHSKHSRNRLGHREASYYRQLPLNM